jgi:hypothetical protein
MPIGLRGFQKGNKLGVPPKVGYHASDQAKLNMSISAKKRGVGKWNKGRKYSIERRTKMGLSKIAEKNPNWLGDKVGYRGVHKWVRGILPKTDLCQCCGKVPPYDLANKGIYDRSVDNWEWLCRKCHMVKDGRINNLLNSDKYV